MYFLNSKEKRFVFLFLFNGYPKYSKVRFYKKGHKRWKVLLFYRNGSFLRVILSEMYKIHFLHKLNVTNVTHRYQKIKVVVCNINSVE